MKLNRGAGLVRAGTLLLLVEEQDEGGSQSGGGIGDAAKWSDWLRDGCGVQTCRRGERKCLT